MARMRLLSTAKNETVDGYCLVKTYAVRTSTKGGEYLDMTLSDMDGDVNAKLWDYQAAVHGQYTPGDVVCVHARVIEWQGAEQLRVETIRHVDDADDVNMADLVEVAPEDVDGMYAELMATVAAFEDEDFQKLTRTMLENHKKELFAYPAALTMHHAYRGGLLYHTVSVLRAAKNIAALYPRLDTDLLYCGVILHDLAKIGELEVSDAGLASKYTAEGELLGHLVCGVVWVNRTAEQLGIDPEKALLVSHMLLSHHGIAEYGSVKPPMFPEAEVLSELDMLDARLFEMFEAIDEVEDREFTRHVWALEKRKLYRHGRDKGREQA
jgi:3'-5' exoribonuclease